MIKEQLLRMLVALKDFARFLGELIGLLEKATSDDKPCDKKEDHENV